MKKAMSCKFSAFMKIRLLIKLLKKSPVALYVNDRISNFAIRLKIEV